MKIKIVKDNFQKDIDLVVEQWEDRKRRKGCLTRATMPLANHPSRQRLSDGSLSESIVSLFRDERQPIPSFTVPYRHEHNAPLPSLD
jgi:hypothetical protein